MFALTGSGFSPLKNFHIEVGQRLYIGNSRFPELVIISNITGGMVHYYDGIFNTRQVMDKPIFKDLAAAGTKTWLNGPSVWRDAEMDGLLIKAQNGESLLPHEKVDFRDFQLVHVFVESRSSDVTWDDAEKFGSVAGLDGGIFRITLSRRELREAKLAESDFNKFFIIIENMKMPT